jgi:DNA-binding MarR family transcriptional regulator
VSNLTSLCDVLSQPDAKVTELLVLASLKSAAGPVTAIAQQIEQPVESVRAAVARLETSGLVETTDDTATLTPAGEREAAQILTSWPSTSAVDLLSAIDLSPVTRMVESLWLPDADRSAAEAQQRAGLLAADADRDAAVERLSAAFSEGRLSDTELESRTASALSARTYGDLDGALQGLGGLPREVRSHPVRKAVFWVVAVLSSPFVLLGSLLFAFGTDAGDHLGGLMFLVLLLPGLFALRRWAWPRM